MKMWVRRLKWGGPPGWPLLGASLGSEPASPSAAARTKETAVLLIPRLKTQVTEGSASRGVIVKGVSAGRQSGRRAAESCVVRVVRSGTTLPGAAGGY